MPKKSFWRTVFFYALLVGVWYCGVLFFTVVNVMIVTMSSHDPEDFSSPYNWAAVLVMVVLEFLILYGVTSLARASFNASKGS